MEFGIYAAAFLCSRRTALRPDAPPSLTLDVMWLPERKGGSVWASRTDSRSDVDRARRTGERLAAGRRVTRAESLRLRP